MLGGYKVLIYSASLTRNIPPYTRPPFADREETECVLSEEALLQDANIVKGSNSQNR
jgi:hypothetical protein